MATLTVILVCQLIGEVISAGLDLPVPGPVIGMVILLSGLIAKGAVPDDIGRTADVLLNNLSLLFVPAGVGVMLHLSVLSDDWLPISVALVVSTTLTVAVTGFMMAKLRRRDDAEKPDPPA